MRNDFHSSSSCKKSSTSRVNSLGFSACTVRQKRYQLSNNIYIIQEEEEGLPQCPASAIVSSSILGKNAFAFSTTFGLRQFDFSPRIKRVGLSYLIDASCENGKSPRSAIPFVRYLSDILKTCASVLCALGFEAGNVDLATQLVRRNCLTAKS